MDAGAQDRGESLGWGIKKSSVTVVSRRCRLNVREMITGARVILQLYGSSAARWVNDNLPVSVSVTSGHQKHFRPGVETFHRASHFPLQRRRGQKHQGQWPGHWCVMDFRNRCKR